MICFSLSPCCQNQDTDRNLEQRHSDCIGSSKGHSTSYDGCVFRVGTKPLSPGCGYLCGYEGGRVLGVKKESKAMR